MMITTNDNPLKENGAKVRPLQPGNLILKSSLIVHTRQAYKLATGLSGSKGSIGLISFARIIRQIHESARKDNPYSELLMLKIFDSMKQLEIDLKRQIDEMKQKLEGYNHLSVDTPFSSSPKYIELNFASVYAYLACHLIGFFDEWARYWYMTKTLGIKLSVSHVKLMRNMMKRILNIFNKTFQWNLVDITRVDVINRTEKFIKAESTLGQIPEAIINKSIRAPFLELKEVHEGDLSHALKQKRFLNDLGVTK